MYSNKKFETKNSMSMILGMDIENKSNTTYKSHTKAIYRYKVRFFGQCSDQ